ncbi:MAG: lipoate--protein ligase family protein [Candidatus Bathyarchaeia archaeon]
MFEASAEEPFRLGRADMLALWRLLEFEFKDPAMNLALEEAIARKVGSCDSPNTFRLWINPYSIILGCHQSVDLEVDKTAWGRFRIPIIRRVTGGGAVYHDHGNLNYSIYTKVSGNRKIDVQHKNSEFSQVILGALMRLGLNPILKSYGVFVRDHKISGSAGSLRWRCLLHHGTLLVNSNLKLLNILLKKPKGPLGSFHPRGFVRSVHAPVTTLESELGRPIQLEEIKSILKRTFEELFSAKLNPDRPTVEELDLALHLYRVKYGRPEWNLMY